METQKMNNRQQMGEILQKPSEELVQSNEELNRLEDLAVNNPFAFEQNSINLDFSYEDEEVIEDYFENQSIEDLSKNYEVSLDEDSIFSDEKYEEDSLLDDEAVDPFEYMQDNFELIKKKVKSYAKENMDRELDKGPSEADLDRVERLAGKVNEEPESEWEETEVVYTGPELQEVTFITEYDLGQDPSESEEDILDRMNNKGTKMYENFSETKLEELDEKEDGIY